MENQEIMFPFFDLQGPGDQRGWGYMISRSSIGDSLTSFPPGCIPVARLYKEYDVNVQKQIKLKK